jgi:hypothetical protein
MNWPSFYDAEDISPLWVADQFLLMYKFDLIGLTTNNLNKTFANRGPCSASSAVVSQSLYWSLLYVRYMLQANNQVVSILHIDSWCVSLLPKDVALIMNKLRWCCDLDNEHIRNWDDAVTLTTSILQTWLVLYLFVNEVTLHKYKVVCMKLHKIELAFVELASKGCFNYKYHIWENGYNMYVVERCIKWVHRTFSENCRLECSMKNKYSKISVPLYISYIWKKPWTPHMTEESKTDMKSLLITTK